MPGAAIANSTAPRPRSAWLRSSVGLVAPNSPSRPQPAVGQNPNELDYPSWVPLNFLGPNVQVTLHLCWKQPNRRSFPPTVLTRNMAARGPTELQEVASPAASSRSSQSQSKRPPEASREHTGHDRTRDVLGETAVKRDVSCLESQSQPETETSGCCP